MANIKFTQNHQHDNVWYESGQVAELPDHEVDSLIELGFGVRATDADAQDWQTKLAEREQAKAQAKADAEAAKAEETPPADPTNPTEDPNAV